MQSNPCPLCNTENAADSLYCSQCKVDLRMAVAVADLRRRVAQLEHTQIAPAIVAPKTTPAVPPIRQTAAQPRPPAAWLTGEFWLNKVGISLVLLALAFFFNYAVQQGWLGPAVRLAIGFAAGAILLGLGTFLQARRPDFGKILQGGGLAAFYITGYASLNLYDLVPYELAFGFMSLTTLAAYGLAARQKSVALAFVALAGGLITPLVLKSDSNNIAAWLAYSGLILACAAALYFWRGWSALLYLGALSACVIASIATGDYKKAPQTVQAFILFLGLLFWLLPMLRLWLNGPATDTLPRRQVGLNLLTLALIPYLVLLSIQIQDWRRMTWGWVFLAIALGLAGLAMLAWRARALRPVWWAHAVLALAFFACGVGIVSESFAWFAAALMAMVCVLAWLWQYSKQGVLCLIAHATAGLGAMILFAVLLDHASDLQKTPILAMALPVMTPLLGAIGLLGAAPWWLGGSRLRWLYQIVAYGLALIWLAVLCLLLPNTQALISAAWGIIGMGVLLLGLRRNMALWRTVGYVTLVIVVAKLFIVDLAEVALLVRVGLFMLLGVAFLLLSYFYRVLGKAK